MEFSILNKAEVKFATGASAQGDGNLITRLSNLIEAEIQATENEDGANSNDLLQLLTTAIVEDPCAYKSKKSQLDWKFAIGISLPNPSSNSATAPDPGPSTTCATNGPFSNISIMSSPGETKSFLTVLDKTFNVFGDSKKNVTINVAVTNFGGKYQSTFNLPSINLTSGGLKPGEFGISSNDGGSTLLVSPSDTTLLAWKNGEEFSGMFTVSLVLSSSALSLLQLMNYTPNGRFSHLRNLLKDEIGTDTEIVVGVSPNQTAIKCHRAFLLAGSKVFQKMFESGLNEAKENRIEMEGISEKGARALLAYLYHRSTMAAFETCEIALELLEAGEKYDIPDLRNIVKKIMLARGSKWYGVDNALSVYIFAKKLCPVEEIKDEKLIGEDQLIDNGVGSVSDNENFWEAIKVKALKVLKWYTRKMPKTMLESVKYQAIFSGDPQLGMEISSAILRLK